MGKQTVTTQFKKVGTVFTSGEVLSSQHNKRKRYKHLRIPEDVYDELGTIGTVKNSYGDVIAKLIKYWKTGKKPSEGSEK